MEQFLLPPGGIFCSVLRWGVLVKRVDQIQIWLQSDEKKTKVYAICVHNVGRLCVYFSPPIGSKLPSKRDNKFKKYDFL